MNNKPVSINIITGFLGVGKTTAILQLLQQKPENERWVIIVNEFGKVAIDNKTLNSTNIEGVEISEVAGGCLCCTASDNFHFALMHVLSTQHPDRITIEPSGLGFLSAMNESFEDNSIKNKIEVRSTICLVDANQLLDVRIQNNEVYREQLKEADVVLINKTDITHIDIIRQFNWWMTENIGPKQFIGTTLNGKIDIELLYLENTQRFTKTLHKPFVHYLKSAQLSLATKEVQQQPTRETPAVVANQTAEFMAFGLLFHPDNCFVKYKLQIALSQTKALRIKGIFKTTTGWFLFNRINDYFSVLPASESSDSRIELITYSEECLNRELFQQEIMQCVQ